MVAEVRKLSSVSLVAGEANADLILGGGGEIWVKGYRSLNPRSGRVPSDGSPVYGGYLSVELRDKAGATLWSTLVTPGADADDAAKDLSKRIAKQLVAALGKLAPGSPATPLNPPNTTPSTQIKGAGATFPYPVYEKWFTNYRRSDPNVAITYDPVGSEAGIRRLLAGEVDFGASDSPEAIRDPAPGEAGKYEFFPAIAGAVVPIVNLPGFTGEIAFTPEALAGIYLGTITKWNDPILKEANRGVRLPDLDIVVVRRADGSGTTYAFTDFLSKTVPAWKERVGTSLDPKWPVGRAATGNDGVAKTVKETGGSIGYVEYIYALHNQLSFGKVRNANGEFVSAGLESVERAANQLATGLSIVNAPGVGAYPIATFTWLVAPAHMTDVAKRIALAGFLNWMLGPGQAQAAALGYVALPKDIADREHSAIDRFTRSL